MRVAVVIPPYYYFWGSRNGWMFQKPLNELSHLNVAMWLRVNGHSADIFNPDALLENTVESQVRMIDGFENAWMRAIEEEEIYERLAEDVFGYDEVLVQVHQGNIKIAEKFIDVLKKRGYAGKVKCYGWARCVNAENIGVVPEKAYRVGRYVIPEKSVFKYGLRDEEFNAVEFWRGCFFRCRFCAKPSIYDGKIVWRNDEALVVADMVNRYRNYGVKKFYVLDNNFNIPALLERVSAVAKLYPEFDEFELVVEARASLMTKKVVEMMCSLGVRRVKLGVEVFDDEALRKLGKGETEKDILLASKLVKERGMLLHVYVLITSAYGIGVKELEKTLDYINEVDPDYVTVSVLSPYPGTEMYDDYGLLVEKEGRPSSYMWAHWNTDMLDFWAKISGDYDGFMTVARKILYEAEKRHGRVGRF